jgi:hypothetical protein
MPVSTELRKIAYTTTIGQTAFPFQESGVKIPLVQSSDLYIKVSTDVLPLDPSLYTVTGNNHPDGWTLTLLTALPAGTKVTLYRQTPMARATDYQENARLFPDTLDADLDRLTMRDIEQQEELNRTDKAAIDGDDDEGYTFPNRDSAKGKVLGFDSITGDMIPVGDLDEVDNLSDLYKANDWDAAITYTATDHTFYDSDPYKPNPANLPAAGESPATNPDKWIKTGGGGATIGNIAPDPSGSKGSADWTVSSATVTTESTTLTGFATELKILTAGAGSAYQTIPVPIQLRGEEIEIRFEGYLNLGAPTIAIKNQAGTVIPSVGTLPTTTGKFTFVGRLFTASDTTGLQLEFTASGAIDLRITNIYIGRPQTVYGAAISQWTAYTPTFTGFGTVTSVNCKWRRSGGECELDLGFIPGTTTAVEARVSLPTGLTSVSTTTATKLAGDVIIDIASGQIRKALIEPSVAYITFSAFNADDTPVSSQLAKVNASAMASSGQRISVIASVPIAEFTGGTVELAAQAGPIYLSNTESVVNTNGVLGKSYYGIDGSPIVPNTASTYYDITLPRALMPDETPKIEVRTKVDRNWMPAEFAMVPSINVRLGGQIFCTAGTGGGSYASSKLAGFNVARTSSNLIRVYTGEGLAGLSSGGGQLALNSWASMIAAADGYDRWRVRIANAKGNREQAPKVYAEAYASANRAISTTVPCNYDTIVEDTHNCITTGASWRFTCKVPGLYQITGYLRGSSGQETCVLFKNGTDIKFIGRIQPTAATYSPISGTIRLATGDYIDFRGTDNKTWDYVSIPGANRICISGPF